MRARRSARDGHDHSGGSNPFATLLELQDALRSKSVYVLDGDTTRTSSTGIRNPAQHVPPGAGARSVEDTGSGAAAGPSSFSAPSSSDNRAMSAVHVNPITSAAELAGGRGYTAEAWEPTRIRMVEEQHQLAARLRAVLEDALQQEQQDQQQEQTSQSQCQESGSSDGHKQKQEKEEEKEQPRPTILQRHAHTVLQLLGVTEAINDGYVLDDYAAPYLSGLARRQCRQEVQMDEAVQVLRRHRAELKRETEAAEANGAVAAAADQDTAMADMSEGEAEVEEAEVEKESDEEWRPPGQRVTANEYAKIYLTSGSGRSRSRSAERKRRRTKKSDKKKKKRSRRRSSSGSDRLFRDGTPEAYSSGDEVLATYQSTKRKKKQKHML